MREKDSPGARAGVLHGPAAGPVSGQNGGRAPPGDYNLFAAQDMCMRAMFCPGCARIRIARRTIARRPAWKAYPECTFKQFRVITIYWHMAECLSLRLARGLGPAVARGLSARGTIATQRTSTAAIAGRHMTTARQLYIRTEPPLPLARPPQGMFASRSRGA